MAKKPAASFRGGLYDGLTSLGVSSPAPSVQAPTATLAQQDAKPAAGVHYLVLQLLDLTVHKPQ